MINEPIIVVIYQLGFWFDGETLHVRCLASHEHTHVDYDSFLTERRARNRTYQKRLRNKLRQRRYRTRHAMSALSATKEM